MIPLSNSGIGVCSGFTFPCSTGILITSPSRIRQGSNLRRPSDNFGG
jgi:hypothetical protein